MIWLLLAVWALCVALAFLLLRTTAHFAAERDAAAWVEVCRRHGYGR
jgi:hypothetical protein